MIPAAISAATALPASSTSAKLAMMQRAISRQRHQLDRHLGHHHQHAFRADHQRQQVEARRVERVTAELDGTSPALVSPRTRMTLCSVSPYFRQCTPPAFSATLPPIVQAIWLDGSGA